VLTFADRALGCILGGAIGDAWGGPFEGMPGPQHFEIPARGKLSDDTGLTLATCESIIEMGHVDPENVAEHFVRWYSTGRIHGLGSSTKKAMRDLELGAHWGISGARGEFAAGNGAAMRIAPLAFVLDPHNPEHRKVIRDVCRITHNKDEAYSGALAVILAIRAVLTEKWSADRSFLSAAFEALPDSNVRDRIFQLMPLRETPFDIARRFGASGFVADSVPLALYCAQSIASDPLPDVLGRAIEAGGDTDTIGSITGQIAGTVTVAPAEFVAPIENKHDLLRIAREFARFVSTTAV
jgi:ADP-ribosylglycohydrolase